MESEANDLKGVGVCPKFNYWATERVSPFIENNCVQRAEIRYDPGRQVFVIWLQDHLILRSHRHKGQYG